MGCVIFVVGLSHCCVNEADDAENAQADYEDVPAVEVCLGATF